MPWTRFVILERVIWRGRGSTLCGEVCLSSCWLVGPVWWNCRRQLGREMRVYSPRLCLRDRSSRRRHGWLLVQSELMFNVMYARRTENGLPHLDDRVIHKP